MLAGKFRFTPGQIRDVASAAGNRAHCFSGGNSFHENFHDVCRNMSHSNLSRLAGKSDAKRSWDDIILAPEQLAHMKEICDQAKYRDLKIVPNSLSLEDLNKLWGTFPSKALKFSASYMLTPVRIPSTHEKTVTRVVEKDLDIYKVGR